MITNLGRGQVIGKDDCGTWQFQVLNTFETETAFQKTNHVGAIFEAL